MVLWALVGSDQMGRILDTLQAENSIVVIDTPPSLVADAQVLAAKVDAVLFVVQPGSTHTEAARSSLETFKRAGARVVGVVLNRIPRNRSYYYGGYKYYSPYSDSKGYYSKNGNGSKPLEQPEDLGVAHPIIEAAPPPSYLTRLSEKLDDYPYPDPPEE